MHLCNHIQMIMESEKIDARERNKMCDKNNNFGGREKAQRVSTVPYGFIQFLCWNVINVG